MVQKTEIGGTSVDLIKKTAASIIASNIFILPTNYKNLPTPKTNTQQ